MTWTDVYLDPRSEGRKMMSRAWFYPLQRVVVDNIRQGVDGLEQAVTNPLPSSVTATRQRKAASTALLMHSIRERVGQAWGIETLLGGLEVGQLVDVLGGLFCPPEDLCCYQAILEDDDLCRQLQALDDLVPGEVSRYRQA